VEAIVLGPASSLQLPLLLRAEVSEDLKRRSKPLELLLPVHDDGCRDNDQVRAPHSSFSGEVGDHRDRLDGFSETHLVSEDTVQLPVVKSGEPVESNDLIWSEHAFE